MTKIIFYTDLHHGPVMEASRPSSVNILGPHAIAMQRALNAYAEQNGVSILLHGGDESTFINTPQLHLHRAKEIYNVMQEFNGHIIRNVGNHDPIDSVEELKFTPNGTITPIEDSSLKVVTCQPIQTSTPDTLLYQYQSKNLVPIFNKTGTQDNLMIAMGHFAFDRPNAGFPEIHPPHGAYAYKETAEEIREILKQKEERTPQSIISVHGHEHRFRLTTADGFRCLTMPSIVQEDPLKEEEPCGLFCEIDLSNNVHALNITFQKVILNTEAPEVSRVQRVSEEYMNKFYYRPYIPKAA